MPLLSNFEWPTEPIDFTSLGDGARDGSAQVVAQGDRWILKSPGKFSYSSGQSPRRTLISTIGGVPALIRGTAWAFDGDLGLRIDEMRIGSTDEDPLYLSVTAQFEHLSELCEYRPEDGPARSSRETLHFPPIGDAPSATATLLSTQNAVDITAEIPMPIAAFEKHLAALQDLLTFAAGIPIARCSLTAVEVSGRKVQILGREKYAPFDIPNRPSYEYPFRLSGTWIQTGIDRWWGARTEWRPVTQLLAGLKYVQGFVEADLILSAVAIESVADKLLEESLPRVSAMERLPIYEALDGLQGLNSKQKQIVHELKSSLSRTTLRTKVEQLLLVLGEHDVERTRINVAEWQKYFLKTRNGVAHGGPGLSAGRSLWIESDLTRAIRDANLVILNMVLMKHLGAPEAVLGLAADRFGVRYGPRHRESSIFTS